MDGIVAGGAGPVDTRQSAYARLRTLPFHDVVLVDGFWSRRQAVSRENSMPQVQRMLEREGGWFHRLRSAVRREESAPTGHGSGVWSDSQGFRWLEAIAYELGRGPSDELSRAAEHTFELVAAAQAEDGYFNTARPSLLSDVASRWKDLSFSHELNVAGHLIQAAIAHHRLVGDSRLMRVARRFADHTDSVFGPGKRAGTSGHPEIEMALIELYRDSGERRYLELARFFLDQRGYGQVDPEGHYRGPEYLQDHVPVRGASTVVGHAVRQLYLNCGVADLYLETGEQALLDALLRQWQDLVRHKLFVTGGIGSRYEGEAIGEPYELPNDRCYCETCAQIASIMWNWRMLLATGEGRFADLIERTLYNALLSGISLDGRGFFYVNPLMIRGTPFVLAGVGSSERQEWFTCPCCPTNVVRFMPALGHYLATSDSEGLQVHLYDSARIETRLPSGSEIRLSMRTDYPWGQKVRIVVEAACGDEWELSLRQPGWCQGLSVRVSGETVDAASAESGYVVIGRRWAAGDVVELSLPMAPRLIEAHPRVDPARGSVAIERGPIVYCLEQPDQEPDVDVRGVEIDESKGLQANWKPDLLGGVVAVKAAGRAVDVAPWEAQLYRPLSDEPARRRPVALTAIPYYAWANRGLAPMRVWIPRKGHGAS